MQLAKAGGEEIDKMREWERMEREQRSRAREDFEREERRRDRGQDREFGGFGSFLEECTDPEPSPRSVIPSDVGVVYWQPEWDESERRQDQVLQLTLRKRAALSAGESLWVVGNALSMGGWNPAQAVQLMPVSVCNMHVRIVPCLLPCGQAIMRTAPRCACLPAES
jgi:hypothetical protein